MECVTPAIVMIATAVILLASILKALDRPESARALRAFGVPGILSEILSFMLPAGELFSVIAIYIPTYSRAGFIALSAIMLVYCIAIAASLLRGLRPTCHCFGKLSTGNISWNTLGISFSLMLCLIIGALSPSYFLQTSIHIYMNQVFDHKAASSALLSTITAYFYIYHLKKLQSSTHTRLKMLENLLRTAGIVSKSPNLDGFYYTVIPIGNNSPSFSVNTYDGNLLASELFFERHKPTLLLFTMAHCSSCERVYSELRTALGIFENKASVLLVSNSEAKPDIQDPHGIISFGHDPDRHLEGVFKIKAVPAAVWIDSSGRVYSAIACGPSAIEPMLSGFPTE